MRKWLALLSCAVLAGTAAADYNILPAPGSGTLVTNAQGYYVWQAAAPATNWYDVYPDYEHTVLLARFTTGQTLSNEAYSVAGGLTDPGGGAAPTFTNDFATFGGNDYIDMQDSFTNYYVATNANWACSFWINMATEINSARYMSCDKGNDSAGGEWWWRESTDDIEIFGGGSAISPGANIGTKNWVQVLYTVNRPGDMGYLYTNGILDESFGLTGVGYDTKYGKAGSPLYLGGRPTGGSLLGCDACFDDVVMWVFPTGATNWLTPAQVTNFFNQGRSSN